MLINADTAILTPSILLVPYTEAHVPSYHEWMKDPEIQTLTASEPLTLEEEYAMQRSWRTDGDKLTFIICLPLHSLMPQKNSPSRTELEEDRIIRAGEFDGEKGMVGDVNLFLSPPEDIGVENPNESEVGVCTGELELMIASSNHRRKGFGRAAVLAFIQYISTHLVEILTEFQKSCELPDSDETWDKLRLRVKIGGENIGSIKLFESLGFEMVGEGVNYFGEVEMWLNQVLQSECDMTSFEVKGFSKLRYD